MDGHGRARTNTDGMVREYAISQDPLPLERAPNLRRPAKTCVRALWTWPNAPFGDLPSSFHLPPSSLILQPPAPVLNPQSAIRNTQPPAFSTLFSVLNPQSPILSPQSSALSPLFSIRNPQSAIPNPQYSVLSTQHSVLSSQSSLSPSFRKTPVLRDSRNSLLASASRRRYGCPIAPQGAEKP